MFSKKRMIKKIEFLKYKKRNKIFRKIKITHYFRMFCQGLED